MRSVRCGIMRTSSPLKIPNLSLRQPKKRFHQVTLMHEGMNLTNRAVDEKLEPVTAFLFTDVLLLATKSKEGAINKYLNRSKLPDLTHSASISLYRSTLDTCIPVNKSKGKLLICTSSPLNFCRSIALIYSHQWHRCALPVCS